MELNDLWVVRKLKKAKFLNSVGNEVNLEKAAIYTNRTAALKLCRLRRPEEGWYPCPLNEARALSDQNLVA